jgi:hypothetical protein
MRSRLITSSDTTPRSQTDMPAQRCNVQHRKSRIRFDAAVDVNAAQRQGHSQARGNHHQRLNHPLEKKVTKAVRGGDLGCDREGKKSLPRRQRSPGLPNQDLYQTKHSRASSQQPAASQPAKTQLPDWPNFAHKKGHPAPCRDSFFN